MSSGTAALQG